MSNSARSTSSSASSVSPSSPPVIPVDTQLPQSMSNSSLSTSSSASLASPSSPPVIPMDPRLRQFLNACNKGDFGLCNHLVIADPDILLSTTPHKNNCLHIAAMLGHDEFAKKVWSRAPSLFSGTNFDGETPLIAALMAANLSLAADIITAASQYMQHNDLEEGRPFNRMLLKVDRHQENVLHHAMRNGFENLALHLLDIEPRLSKQVTNTGESPMYMAARRGYSTVIERLLQIPYSADCGPTQESALYAAMKFDHIDIVKQLLEGRPQVAYQKDNNGYHPLMRAIIENNLTLVKVLLEYDNNLGYINQDTGCTPFILAVQKGYVSIAKAIMATCHDSVYTTDNDGNNALIHAIWCGKKDSIGYILETPLLHRFINQRNKEGRLPLHEAASTCNPQLLRSLLTHTGQDYTAVDYSGYDAFNVVYGRKVLWLTLRWVESFIMLLSVIPSGWKHVIYTRHNEIYIGKNTQIKVDSSFIKDHTSNTSVVAALLATITFAAAFTLPGGFSSDPAHAGLPIFARKAAFQVFLISDTIAMSCSLVVAFLCVLTSWNDMDFLLNYIKTTMPLMWCAYVATVIAFGTGLFTVLAPNNLRLATSILVVCTILPFIPKIINEWPILMLRYRLGGLFRKELIQNI